MKRPRLHVSDHAIVRYLERVGGFDIERLRAEISRRLQPAADIRAGAVQVDGHIFCIAYGDQALPTVTTILCPEDHPQPHIKLDRRP